jgi:hypothetical protein
MLVKRTFQISLLVVFGASLAPSQDPLSIVREWLPLAVGDRWTYDDETRDGDRRHPDVEHWIREETTVAIESIPEGTLIRRAVRFLDGTGPPSWRRVPTEAYILVRGACIYRLNEFGWNSERHELRAEFREYLNRGAALPNACFPLHQGQTWGDPNKGRDLWTVAGLGPKNNDDPPTASAESWRLEANLASGDDNYVWFQKGVGVTAARTFHNGTYRDSHVRLVRFEPAH